MNRNVYITKVSSFFPNEPVSNDDMEKYLGMIHGRPSLARRIVLRNNGIKERYYALDLQGNVTHTNVQMAARAVEKLCDSDFSVEHIELLSAGTASPEQILPSHGVMIHGELGGKNMEVVSFAGSCCTGIQALKYAWLSILSGQRQNAVCVASERLSPWMQATYFSGETKKLAALEQNPMLAFEKEFLRWMLSDGAGAVRLSDKPANEGLSLSIDWIEICSYAHEQKTCMYAGAERDSDGNLLGWTMFPESEWLTKSLFSLKQDTRQLGEQIVNLGARFLMEIVSKKGLKPDDIDWFLPHLSSMFFKDKIFEALLEQRFEIPQEKWYVNLPTVGNIGSASIFVMLEGLLCSGKVQRGQKILLMIPESARFSYGFCLLTVC